MIVWSLNDIYERGNKNEHKMCQFSCIRYMRKLLFGRKVGRDPLFCLCMSVPKVALILVLASGQKKSIFTRTCKKYRTLLIPYGILSTTLIRWRVGQGSDNAHYDAVSTDQRKADIHQTYQLMLLVQTNARQQLISSDRHQLWYHYGCSSTCPANFLFLSSHLIRRSK